MNLIELERSLRQPQVDAMPPIDLLSCLVSDELTRRSDRLLERRYKEARFRDPNKTLDKFRLCLQSETESQPGV